MRAIARAARAVGHALAGWSTIAFRFPRLSEPQRQACVQAWATRMLQILGIEVQVHGSPAPAGPMLLVANHISWLDILVLHAARYCRFIAKSDVKHWPLVGALATGGGTLYIERASRRDAMRVVHHMVERLRAGEVLAIFPEGTTSDGTHLLPFHGNLVQAAISAHVPVQPAALQYLDAATGATSLAASYVGDDSLLGSVWRTLTAPPIRAVVRFGEPEAADGRDRRAWARDLHDAVGALRQRA